VGEIPEFDAATFSIAGVFIVSLLIGLTQVFRELTGVPGRFVPLFPLGLALALVFLNAFFPALTALIVVGLAAGMGAVMTVSFAKRDENGRRK
jgi:hypothetical protein